MYSFTPVIIVLALVFSTSTIMVPQDFSMSLEVLEVYQQERSNGDRRLISNEIAVDREKRDNVVSSIPCIQSYLNENIKDPSRCTLIIMDDDEDVFDIVKPFMIWLKSHYAFFTHSPLVDFEFYSNNGELTSSAILLMPRAESLQSQFYILDPCDRGCLYVVILLDSFDDEDSFLYDAAALSEAMWNRKLSIIAILGKVGDSMLVAGSLSFEPDSVCTPAAPEILGKCKDGDWKDLKTIGPLKLNDCYLKVAYLVQPPFVFTVNGSDHLEGFEGCLIEEISKDLNLVRQQVEWSDNTSFAEQVRMMLYDDTKADIVVGRILQSRDDDIEYSTTYDMVEVVWLVPKIPEVSLKGLIKPFNNFVWAAIGGSLVLGALFKVFMLPDVAGLDIFAMIIGIAVYKQPTRPSRRVHFISWSIFGLFLAQLYIDSLADQLINLSTMKIETTQELLASSIKLGGTAAFFSIVESYDDYQEFINNLKDELEVFDYETYIELLSDLLSGRNTTYALVVALNSSRSKAVETPYAYAMTTSVICSYPVSLATWKGFPQLSMINSRIQHVIDYGMFDFMVSLALENDTRARLFAMAQDDEYKSNLHLQQFVPVFLLMVIGFGTGLIILILEIMLYPWKMLE
ncbi:uncharacterized protein LOC143216669 [Lasioglossum baleicum]|uniref:uncharacterized protein LOC143216669 n=1 Tax=Lasioglossum baleicum TaxID=434251 RepID=UPI003FCEA8A5